MKTTSSRKQNYETFKSIKCEHRVLSERAKSNLLNLLSGIPDTEPENSL